MTVEFQRVQGVDALSASQDLTLTLVVVHLKDVEVAGDEVNVLLGKGIVQSS